jgi:MYXO-CTERM domain-containing protein
LWAALCASVLATLFNCTIAQPALATATFSLVLLQAPYESKAGCQICHIDALGGAGTAVQPFAETLKQRGLNKGSSASELSKILDELDDADSDDDGRADLEEILSGGDPNTAGRGKATEVLEYHHGCATLPAAPATGWAAGLLALVAFCFRCRRTRARDLKGI